MIKRTLGLLVSAALFIGLTTLQASVPIKYDMKVVETKVVTEQLEVIDFVWPCEFAWQIPPQCL